MNLKLFLSGLLIVAGGARALGQYSISWSTIDGGGGTSAGGAYSISGTIGQHDAGTMSGGNCALAGGFWGLVAAVQTEGPYLTVYRSNNTVVISWPLPASGWVLYSTTDLVTSETLWTEVAPPYQTNGLNLQVIEAEPTGSKFYRLYKP